ncbi:TetR/AcrR family transcriptional regulator [Nocardia sp. NPDC024068]|uniref:TetR/AcrR family transcriptional regulator n=1 Tax=Nocardia sp. NPDC024068 TaxID=3157197 RepID=UPI00340F4934
MRADARRNLDKIVAAAAEVVAEYGVNAPMKAVADRAGVGVGTLYRRFPDRNALIAAIGLHYLDSIAQALAHAAGESTDAWSAIRQFVMWVAESGRGALAAALAELPDEAFTENAEFAAERFRWVQQLEDLVRRARADGTIRPDVRGDDIVYLLNVFTCHPDALPGPVADRPMKYLHYMLDGMQAAAATPLAGQETTAVS